jgi:hypothetical protein
MGITADELSGNGNFDCLDTQTNFVAYILIRAIMGMTSKK